MAVRFFLGAALIGSLLAGCAATDTKPPSSDELALPDAVADALLPGYTLPAPAAPRSVPADSRYFDVDVSDLDAKLFFRSLVEGTPYSIVLAPGVEGRITLKLQAVTLEEVLETLRDIHGYQIRQRDRRITVLPASLQTRTFQINYLNLQRSGESRTRVSSGQILDASGNSGGNGRNVSTGGAQRGGGDAEQASSTGSMIQTRSESDFWRELGQTLRLMVRERDGHSLALSPESGLVMVRANPEVLREVGDYIRALHANLHRQVILETKILEVTLSEGFQAGINWAQLAQDGNKTATLGIVGGSNIFEQARSALANSALVISPNSGPALSGFVAPASGGAFVAALDLPDFSGVIELLERQGDVQVLSSPRISTVNNQKAIIKVGTDEFFVTRVSQNSVVATGNTSTQSGPTVELTPFFSGIALDVTPRIYEPEDVILHVHPTVSEVTERVKSLVVGGEEQELPLAISNLRETDSIVRARSGQVVVIGGLMQSATRDEQVGLPLISRIPLIGGLFRQTRRSLDKSELVILMRPIVVDADGTVWNADLQSTEERLQRLSGKRLLNQGWASP